jgi:capsular polysaccharide transport system permease protein
MESIHNSLRIQYSVIKALVLREVITRWGRKNIAFMWIFVEPIIFIFIFSLLWSFRGAAANYTFNSFKISPIAFILLGYSSMMLWRNSATLISNAIKTNVSLLYHRNLRPLDFYISRYILEMAGVSGAFILLLLISITSGIIPPPKNIPLLTLAWILMIWFSLGFGLTFGILISQFEILAVIWRGIAIFFFITSGALFFVAWLPHEYKDIALIIPMVHGSEMIKHGYFGEVVKTYEDPFYLIKWCIALNLVGLTLTKHFGSELPERI